MKLNLFKIYALILLTSTSFSLNSNNNPAVLGKFIASKLEHQRRLKKYEPLLVIVLMVKNEEESIVQTLKPYVDAGIQSYLVFDTGSTDKTIELAQNYFKENKITDWHIEQEPFVDFATSRNRGLELAQQKFPNAAFMLMPDAEWYLTNAKELLAFCKKNQHSKNDCYLLRIMNPAIDFYTPRLIRCNKNVKFVGSVHEVPAIGTRSKVPDTVYFYLNPTAKGAQKSQQRYARDKELLLKEYKQDKTNSRACFYLAQTFHCLGDLQNAYKYYKKRTKLKGWDEENYMTWYRLAQVTEELCKKDNEKKDLKFTKKWHQALKYYLNAHSLLPRRAEPIVKIAEHYLYQDNFAIAYIFAKRAIEIPYPSNDLLFIDKDLYVYKRYEVLSRCAWYIGQYDVGEEAAIKALEAKPDLPHLKFNLDLYTNRKLRQQNKIKPVTS